MTTTRSIGGHIWRGIIVLIAFGLSIAVALVVLTVIGALTMSEDLRASEEIEGELGMVVQVISLLFGGASFLYVLTPTLTIIPALLVAIIGEVASIRSLLFYLIAAGLAAAALPLLALEPGASVNLHGLTLFATAGFAGGLTYWLLAGRKA